MPCILGRQITPERGRGLSMWRSWWPAEYAHVQTSQPTTPSTMQPGIKPRTIHCAAQYLRRGCRVSNTARPERTPLGAVARAWTHMALEAIATLPGVSRRPALASTFCQRTGRQVEFHVVGDRQPAVSPSVLGRQRRLSALVGPFWPPNHLRSINPLWIIQLATTATTFPSDKH